jgi:alpha-L-glutamate ligase-like protein/uncharacterized protein (TIGR02421 family)
MASFFNSKGILGINARNLLYIKPFNKRKDILFADDKLKTKHYLAARGVSVPKLFGVIKSKEDLNKFDFSSLPSSFVLKPNLGAGGEGIIPFKESKNGVFTTLSNKTYTTEMLKAHIIDIVDGRFSVNNNPDSAFFEQRIITHESLTPYTYKGLPDIRVVVFNLVPVMAMLRLPTKESDGRANLQQGALGIGIDLAKGETTYISLKKKIIPEIPGVGPIKIKIPHWDQILEIAVKGQLTSNLGYLAADIALDQSGPVLLELNARAGLKVQIANQAGLLSRLKKVEGIKVTTPEKGIRIAKDMFGNVAEKKISTLSGHTVVGPKEHIQIIKGTHNILSEAKLNVLQEKTTISPMLAEKLHLSPDSKKFKLALAGKRITTAIKINSEQEEEIVIGRRDLADFIIDPNKKNTEKVNLPKLNKKKSGVPYIYTPKLNYGKIDHQIYELDGKIKLVSHLTPQNLKEEIEKVKADKSYNPQFIYKQSEIDFFQIRQELANIQTNDTALGQLFKQKKAELGNRFELVESIGTDNFHAASQKNFPKPKADLIDAAYKKLDDYFNRKPPKPPKTITDKKAKQVFSEVLVNYGLKDWKVVLKKNMSGNCSVSKQEKIFIKQGAKFSEQRLKKLIAHEIDTHILTNANGAKQPYRLFQIGTANYLKTQEGLAVYNQEKFVHAPDELLGASTFIATYLASKYSFVETMSQLISLGFDEDRAISLTSKAKRGLEDTSKPGAFTKGYIYFMGAQQIKEFVEAGGKLQDLYIGKIDLESLDLINTISSINKPYYLPAWY